MNTYTIGDDLAIEVRLILNGIVADTVGATIVAGIVDSTGALAAGVSPIQVPSPQGRTGTVVVPISSEVSALLSSAVYALEIQTVEQGIRTTYERLPFAMVRAALDGTPVTPTTVPMQMLAAGPSNLFAGTATVTATVTVTGTLQFVGPQDSATMAGNIENQGALSAAVADTLSSSSEVRSQGALTATNPVDVLASTSQVRSQGAFAVTEPAVVLSGVGQAKVNASLAATNIDIFAGAGSIIASYITDTFVGADDTPLNGRTTTTGAATWTAGSEYTLDGTGAIKMAASNADGILAFVTVPQTRFKFTTQLASTFGDTDNKAYMALLIHYIDANNFMHIEPDPQNNVVHIYRKVGGNYTLIFDLPMTLTSGQLVPVTIGIEGNEIKFEIGGFTKFTYFENNITASYKVGFRASSVGTPPAPCRATAIDIAPRGNTIRWPVFTKDASATPIIALGAGGAWDNTDVNNPTVFWHAASSKWICNYSGYNSTQNQIQDFGYALADSLTGPWTKYASNPVIEADGLDDKWAFNGGIAFWQGKYWSVQGSNGGNSLRVRTSTDGYAWTDRGIQWSPGQGGSYCSVTVYDAFLRVTETDQLELWCGVYDGSLRRIARGYVNADYTITKPASAIFAPPTNVFGNVSIGEPSVFVPPGKEGQEILLSYDSNIFSSTHRSVAHAASLDGGVTWEHRIFASEGVASRPWEALQNFDSHMLLDNNVLHLWYGGAAYDGNVLDIGIQIGHASMPWTYSTLVKP